MNKVIIFDKDGTLFDFQATWGYWTGTVIDHLSDGDDRLRHGLAQCLSYDLEHRVLRPDSFVIAGTPREIVSAIKPILGDRGPDDLLGVLNDLATTAPQVLVTDLAPVMSRLRDLGYKLAVMTNDSEAPAMAHLRSEHADGLFDMIVGSDSGYGAKPDPDPLLAICEKLNCDPHQSWMVGDSTHDLRAGRAAEMSTIGVLTGPASPETLRPFATKILDTIAGIPDFLTTSI